MKLKDLDLLYLLLFWHGYKSCSFLNGLSEINATWKWKLPVLLDENTSRIQIVSLQLQPTDSMNLKHPIKKKPTLNEKFPEAWQTDR